MNKMMSIRITDETRERARDFVYCYPEYTLSLLMQEALEFYLNHKEHNGMPIIHRDKELKRGVKVRQISIGL